jgi:hypothetical protein
LYLLAGFSDHPVSILDNLCHNATMSQEDVLTTGTEDTEEYLKRETGYALGSSGQN